MTLPREFTGLTTGQVAERLGLHRSTVWGWIRSGALPSKKIRGYESVSEADLEKFLSFYHLTPPKKRKRKR